MNTTISISKNKFVALSIALLMLLLAVLFLGLKPEKPQDELFSAINAGEPVFFSAEIREDLEKRGIHSVIFINAKRELLFVQPSTGNIIDVCDANAGEKSNTLTNQKTYGSQSAANETCQLSPRMLQQLLSCPSYCPTRCNVSGITVCAHSVSGKKYRGCHKTTPAAPGNHAECQ